MSKVTNARLLFNSVPSGYPIPGETTILDKSQTIDVDNVELNGGFVAKIVALSIDPYMRGKMRDASVERYSSAFKIGEPIDSLGVAKVLRSYNSDVKTGDILYGSFPFQEYFIGTELGQLRKLNNESGIPLHSYVGSAGMPGKTAYYGWKTHFEKTASKDKTIFISTAAGPVGSFLVQLAKWNGLKVIGSTGSDEKVAFLKSIGTDVAINYKKEDMRAILQKEGPIDFYWDQVGGDTLDAALENMKLEGIVVVCGQIASYNGTPVPVKNFPTILWKRLTVAGFMVFTKEHLYADEFYREVPPLIAGGKLKIVEHKYSLEEAGQALLDVQKGDNKGKAVVILEESK